jgi:hypothetical protein
VAVSLSNDGRSVAIGSEDNGNGAGHVRVFDIGIYAFVCLLFVHAFSNTLACT